MFYIEFVASEPITGDIELDLADIDTKEEATEVAIKAIQQQNPTFEDIQITLIKEI